MVSWVGDGWLLVIVSGQSFPIVVDGWGVLGSHVYCLFAMLSTETWHLDLVRWDKGEMGRRGLTIRPDDKQEGQMIHYSLFSLPHHWLWLLLSHHIDLMVLIHLLTWHSHTVLTMLGPAMVIIGSWQQFSVVVVVVALRCCMGDMVDGGGWERGSCGLLMAKLSISKHQCSIWEVHVKITFIE